MFQLRDYVSNATLKNAVYLGEIGVENFAWDKKSALEIVEAIKDTNIGIWGGDVYEVLSNGINSTCDNWYAEPYQNEDRTAFFLRSKLHSKQYIEKYPIYGDKEILFCFVLTDYVIFDLKQEEELF